MLHDLLGQIRPTATQTHASDFHVDDEIPNSKPPPSEETQETKAQIAGVPLESKPVIALILVLGLLFSIRLTKDATQLAMKKDKTVFRELDITLWNVVMVSLLAIPGIAMWKFFTKQYLHPENPFRVLVDAV